jgi:hypothetical protein
MFSEIKKMTKNKKPPKQAAFAIAIKTLLKLLESLRLSARVNSLFPARFF